MRRSSVFLIFSCALFLYIVDSEAGPACNPACTKELNPVCGRYVRPNGTTEQCTFANPCLFRLHKCQMGEPWVSSPGACPQNTVDCERQIRG
ncbi:four-domain proteases inhibitor-like [Lucilia cuprina]|uniref:four-domain proteases inhibitor-like n=1 Tax=Lucilia cuprina TaxID=7375 RepID=UPI001F05480E|nr:four-domain proteases inhibitor-like [Lucilia cuprina]